MKIGDAIAELRSVVADIASQRDVTMAEVLQDTDVQITLPGGEVIDTFTVTSRLDDFGAGATGRLVASLDVE